MKKLTLSARESTITAAKRLAAENGCTVSEMFERIITSLTANKKSGRIKLGRATLNATGLIQLSSEINGLDILEDALLERYGLNH